MEVEEGDVVVDVSEGDDGVFFNPVQELNRDLTIATLGAFKERSDGGVESYLDATAASGIRGVRAAAAGFDVTCCDVDPAAVDLARRNFDRNSLAGTVLHRDANAYMHESWVDVVDIDPFGTPIPFIDASCNCARDLLCVTATDTAPLCGAHFESGVRTYGAVPRNTEFHAEMGLRVLLSALVRTAARYDVAARPVLSHVSNHYARTYLSLDSGARDADALLEKLGYIDWCPECLYREHDYGLIADPLTACPNCGTPIQTAGPIWLAPPHDPGFVTAVGEQVTDEMGTAVRARRLVNRLVDELDTPTHYDQHRLSETWGQSAIAMDEFISRLQAAGFEASRTHYGGTTVKTTATIMDMFELFAADGRGTDH